MGVEQPEALAACGFHPPVIPQARAPVWIIQPPFRRDPFGAVGGGGGEVLSSPAKGFRRCLSLGCIDEFDGEQDQRTRGGLSGPVVCRFGPGGGHDGGGFFRYMAVGGMETRDRLQPHACANPGHQIIQPGFAIASDISTRQCLSMTRVLGWMQRLGLRGNQADAVDAKAGVNGGYFEGQQRADTVGVVAGPCKTGTDAFAGMIGAKKLHTDMPQTFAMAFEFVAKRRQQAVEGGHDVVLGADGFGQGKPRGEVDVGAGRGDRFGFDSKGLIKTPHHIAAKATRKGGAGQTRKIVDPPDAKPGEIGRCCRVEPQGGHRQGGKGRAGFSRCGDGGGFGLKGGGGRGTSFGPVATRGAGSCGAGFLIYRIARTKGLPRLAGIAGQRPGGPGGVGDADLDAEFQGRTIGLNQSREVLFAAKKMGASGDIKEEGRGGLFRDMGGEFSGPAAQKAEECHLGECVFGAGDQLRAEGAGVAQGLAGFQPFGLGGGAEAGEELAVVVRFDSRQRATKAAPLCAEHPFGSQTWKPQRQNAAGLGHENCSLFVPVVGVAEFGVESCWAWWRF